MKLQIADFRLQIYCILGDLQTTDCKQYTAIRLESAIDNSICNLQFQSEINLQSAVSMFLW